MSALVSRTILNSKKYEFEKQNVENERGRKRFFLNEIFVIYLYIKNWYNSIN